MGMAVVVVVVVLVVGRWKTSVWLGVCVDEDGVCVGISISSVILVVVFLVLTILRK